MSGEANGWTVYVIALKKTVLNDPRFREANPHWQDNPPCVYVGLTFRTADERFEQHKMGIHSARIVRKFGKHVRAKDCKCLRPMSRKTAEKHEAKHAQLFREKGFAVWSN